MHSCAQFILLCSLILHTLFYCALLHLNFSLILHTLLYCALLHLNFPSNIIRIRPTCGFKCSISGPPVDSHQDSPTSGPPVDPDQPRPPAHLWNHIWIRRLTLRDQIRPPACGMRPGFAPARPPAESNSPARLRNQARIPFFLIRFFLFRFIPFCTDIKEC